MSNAPTRRGPQPKDPLTRLMKYIVQTPEGHWHWTGNAGQIFNVGNQMFMGARTAAWVFTGHETKQWYRPRPQCGDADCLNPTHHTLVPCYNGFNERTNQ